MAVTLSRSGDYTLKVKTSSQRVHSLVGSVLTFDVPGAFVAKKRCSWLETWDGKKKLYKSIDDNEIYCSYGLKHRVVNVLRENGIDFTEEQQSQENIPYAHLVKYIQDGNKCKEIHLDAIQEEACKILLSSNRCSIVLGTSSGKTEVFCNSLMCLLTEHPDWKITVMVPKRVLLRETFRRVKHHFSYFNGGKYRDSVGIVGDGVKDVDKQITLCTGATAAASTNISSPEEILKWRRALDVLVLDEAHNSTSPGWRKVIEESEGFKFVWAVSGKLTYQDQAKKLKQAELESLFGPPLLVGNNQKRQCPVKVRVYDIPGWKSKMPKIELATSLHGEVGCSFVLPGEENVWRRGVRISPDSEGRVPEWMMVYNEKGIGKPDKSLYGIYLDGEKVDPVPESIVYDTASDWGYVECRFRNDWILELAAAFERKDESYLISLSRIRHVQKLYRMAKDKGLSVGVLSSGMTGKAQQRVIADLRERKIKGVISHWKPIGEGLDIPRLVHLIKADGMVEEQVLEQQKGRVQRAYKGKDFGYVHLPADNHVPSLASKARKIERYFLTIGLKVETVNDTQIW